VRGTAKSVLGFVRPLLKRIPLPVVGALIDFGLSVALGESPGKAAFKSIGAGLAGFIGAAIGSIPVLIPFGGPLIGGILGGMAGDALGSALYDMFFGGKKPKPQKTTKAATGGPITRGGKPVGGTVTRTIKKAKRTVKIQPTKVKPGASVGGEEKIKKIFPEVKTGDKGKKVDTLGYMKSSYDKSSSIPGFGGLFGIHSKAQLGQKPSDLDYQNAAAGLNAWMQRTFSSEIMRTGGAFAEGGSVDVGMFGSGEDMTNMIAKSLEDNISPKMNDIFNDLQKQLMLKEPVEEKKESPGQEMGEDMGGGGNATEAVGGARLFMAEGFPMLAASILAGNVQAESGWKGQRTPWVLNDGAGTNKGLISWNRERIVNAEKFLGKPLEKASNGEQVRWIKEELKQYGLLDIFLNPKSTEAELKSASYKYIGWGELGDRWQQSSRIFAALQKGEKGSFVVGSDSADPDGVANIKGGKAFPLIKGQIGTGPGQVYGASRDYGGHAGVDVVEKPPWGKDPKLPIAAYSGGKVLSEKYNANDPYLSGLMIDHGKFQTRYLHATPSVRPGDTVQPGQKIGKLLNLGGQTHLHFEAYQGSTRLNPTKLLQSAYLKGGRVLKPTLATLAEDGRPEFVFDADTTKGLDSLAPNLLEYLNVAKTKSQLMGVLQSYAGYETGAEEVIEVVIPQSQMVPLPIPMSSGIGGFGGMSGGSSDSSYDSLYAGS
jgi:murein DD-endopeptidase MepM/ murein hydrolase activator NlpD